MTTRFEDVYDWTAVPVGEEVTAASVRDHDHANIFSDLAQVWGANAGMIDIGLYTFDRRGLVLTYKVGSNAPVVFSESGQRVTNTLVEKAMLKMPIGPAVALAEGILEAAKLNNPELVTAALNRFSVL